MPSDYVARLNDLVGAGRRGDAGEFFLTRAVGVPAEAVAQMRADPGWSVVEGVAHTLAYDGEIMGDMMSGRPLPADRWTAVTPMPWRRCCRTPAGPCSPAGTTAPSRP